MSKVIKFPESKSKKAQELRKAEGRRVFLTLSMLSLVLVAVVLNDQVLTSYRPVYVISDNGRTGRADRAIASDDDRQSITYRDLLWEKELAQRLAAADGRQPAAVPQAISMLDQLRFGDLAGRYAFDVRPNSAGQSVVIGFIYKDPLSAGGEPINISDSGGFLMKYHQLFGGGYQSVFEKQSSTTSKMFNLLDAKNQVVGEADFSFDSQGRLLQLQFHSQP